MKHILINKVSILLFACMATIFWGCEEDPNFKKYIYPMPEVTEMYPQGGYATGQVTILGSNFGDRTEAVKIFFGGIAAENVLSCKDNCIVVQVPEKALSGDVLLQLWNNPGVSIGTFTVFELPTLTSIMSDNQQFGPAVAVPGDLVTIIGSGFGTDESAVSVSFNGTPAEIRSFEDTRIVAVTPEGYASGAVLITINGFTLTGTGLMNPEATGDVTMFYLKNFKRPFTKFDYAAGQEGDGGMAIPTDWVVEDAAKIFVNKNATSPEKVGGMFNKANALGMQAGWGGSGSASSVTNGKMYQTVTLPAGVYKLEITYIESNVATDKVYTVIALGAGLPDSDLVETNSIAFSKFNASGTSEASPGTETLEFTLDNATEISIGFTATFGNNKYFKVSNIRLDLIEKK